MPNSWDSNTMGAAQVIANQSFRRISQESKTTKERSIKSTFAKSANRRITHRQLNILPLIHQTMAPYTTAGVPGLFFKKKIKAVQKRRIPSPKPVKSREMAMNLDASESATIPETRNEEDMEVEQGFNDNEFQAQSVDGPENQVSDLSVNGTETDNHSLQQLQDTSVWNHETDINSDGCKENHSVRPEVLMISFMKDCMF